MNDRQKRTNMRANRRGMKENDIILGNFADIKVGNMQADALDRFEQLLEQPDQSIYKWVIGTETTPSEFHEIIEEIRVFHQIN